MPRQRQTHAGEQHPPPPLPTQQLASSPSASFSAPSAASASQTWTHPPVRLPYDPLLVLFAEGIRETVHPHNFVSRQAFAEMLKADGASVKAASTLPLLSRPQPVSWLPPSGPSRHAGAAAAAVPHRAAANGPHVQGMSVALPCTSPGRRPAARRLCPRPPLPLEARPSPPRPGASGQGCHRGGFVRYPLAGGGGRAAAAGLCGAAARPGWEILAGANTGATPPWLPRWRLRAAGAALKPWAGGAGAAG